MKPNVISPIALHIQCYAMGVKEAKLTFHDGLVYEYIQLSPTEFQLFLEGNTPTNYDMMADSVNLPEG